MPIRTPTVLILGAGASAPYGFPLGVGLRDKVCGFSNSPWSVGLFQELGHSEQEIDAFLDNLRHSAHRSVDVFLEHNPEFLAIGKRFIAMTLLPHEARATLFPGRTSPQGHWYEYLINRIGTGSWTNSDLTIITFNYDRSFEHYFTKVIAQRARVPADEAYERFCHVRVIHVHGSLGTYGGPATTQLGFPVSPLTAEVVDRAAQQILVVSEAADTLSTFANAASALSRARRIYFLGFGFNADNVRRLRFFDETEPSAECEVWGTAQGINGRDWAEIAEKVLKGHWRGIRRAANVGVFVRDWGEWD